MNTSKAISSRYIFVVCLSLLSVARMDAADQHKLSPVFKQLMHEASRSTPQQQPTVQFPATPTASTTSLLDSNQPQQQQQYVPLSVGMLLQPLQGIKFQKDGFVFTAENNRATVSLNGERCSATLSLYEKCITIYPNQVVAPNGSVSTHNGEMILYDNGALSVGPDYMISNHGDARVIIMPLRAYYTLGDGMIVELGQVPCHYFKAQNCALSTTLGANGLSTSITKVDLSNNFLTSWHDIQVNLLAHMPQLKTLILDNNLLFGVCILDHKQLETLQASNTNTVACKLNLPAARTIDLSYGKIVQCDTKSLVCAPGAQINLRGNPIMAMPNVIDINKRALRFDLRETPLSIEAARPMLTPMLKLRSLINPYVYRISEAVHLGSLQIASILSLCVIANWSLHSCEGAKQRNGTLLVGMMPFVFTAGSISLAQKLLGVATTPKTVICDDGCMYASYTIEKNSEDRKDLKALPWLGTMLYLLTH